MKQTKTLKPLTTNSIYMYILIFHLSNKVLAATCSSRKTWEWNKIIIKLNIWDNDSAICDFYIHSIEYWITWANNYIRNCVRFTTFEPRSGWITGIMKSQYLPMYLPGPEKYREYGSTEYNFARQQFRMNIFKKSYIVGLTALQLAFFMGFE